MLQMLVAAAWLSTESGLDPFISSISSTRVSRIRSSGELIVICDWICGSDSGRRERGVRQVVEDLWRVSELVSVEGGEERC